ncbi:N-acetylgalactosamine-6-sulfatase-like isoform X3 [Tigriopus californicus]|nr:N-acetylgalactosamine-6-sulfatase-like isoform X3 [Tigriopus californicus]
MSFKRQNNYRGLVTSVIFFLFCFCVNSATKLPNFILLNLDDVGWGDFGVHGNPARETPRIDQMVSEGMDMTSFYTAAPLCSPSRAAMLSGRLPIRNGLYSDNAFGRNAYTPQDIVGGIASSEILLQELLRKGGYHTKLIGKWHLGHRAPYHPLKRGFNEWYGAPNVHFQYDGTTAPNIPVYKDQNMIGRFYEGIAINLTTGISEYTQHLGEEALEYISRRGRTGKPFFLYWNPDSTHAPSYASARFRGRSQRGTAYGDALIEVDDIVGKMLDLLVNHKLENDTLVVLTSDNGAALVSKREAGTNAPFLCGKQTTFEGGFRTPAFFWWPNKIPAGNASSQVGTQMDLFATFLDLAGLPMPRDRVYDSISLKPALMNGDLDLEKVVFFYRGNGLFAVRKGRFKMHLWTWRTPQEELKRGIDYCPNIHMDGIVSATQVNHTAEPILFDVDNDPEERYPIRPGNSPTIYETAVGYLKKVVEKHQQDLVPGKPALNYCDPAVENWAPPGCEDLDDCLPIPASKVVICDWPH